MRDAARIPLINSMLNKLEKIDILCIPRCGIGGMIYCCFKGIGNHCAPLLKIRKLSGGYHLAYDIAYGGCFYGARNNIAAYCIGGILAKCFVLAENDDDAIQKAAAEFREMYHGTGTVLGKIRITKSVELPVDWSYGEGEAAKPGDQDAMDALIAHNVIR